MLCSRYEVSTVLVVRKRMMVDITALHCTALVSYQSSWSTLPPPSTSLACVLQWSVVQ